MIIINNKICTVCYENKPLDAFYSSLKKSNIRGEYIYYNPECKTCTANRVKMKRENPDEYKKHVEQQRVRNLLPEVKEQKKRWRDSSKGKENRIKWANENKSKFKEYREKRTLHKDHNITNLEWELCKEFFNNTCAYCGINEEIAKIEQGQHLHKEHAINFGSNDVTNCVPSCKSCNTSKWKHDYDKWYTEINPVFDRERLKKIHDWLYSESIKVKESIFS